MSLYLLLLMVGSTWFTLGYENSTASSQDTTREPQDSSGYVLLPDLVPDTNLLETSAYIEDKPLKDMVCALEEKCLSPSAYKFIDDMGGMGRPDRWGHHVRRLLRFSSLNFNIGKGPFQTHQDRKDWEWHQCHKHYHSMTSFSHYDLLDKKGKPVAEGLKASYCLWDTLCRNGGYRKFHGCYIIQSHQGISPNCGDLYEANIDCQWIDVTDVPVGLYTLLIQINPNAYVAEESFENNSAVCAVNYKGLSVEITKCHIQPLRPVPSL